MTLYIGGKAQEKLKAALEDTGLPRSEVCDGASCPLDGFPALPILNHLHLLVRRLMEAGIDPAAFVEAMAAANPDLVVICDEVGCGIVPTSVFERQWREAVGRICCSLAARSQRVLRVVAGIPRPIKEA